MNDNQNFWNALNLLNLYSIYLAQLNLEENRAQSAYNDVHAANNQQAEYLLNKLSKRFDDIQDTLNKILKAVSDSDK